MRRETVEGKETYRPGKKLDELGNNLVGFRKSLDEEVRTGERLVL